MGALMLSGTVRVSQQHSDGPVTRVQLPRVRSSRAHLTVNAETWSGRPKLRSNAAWGPAGAAVPIETN